MATSPDYLRLATSSARALAHTALDSLRDAVVIVDARHNHLPVVLVNETARRCLGSEEAVSLIESSLHRWLGAASASTIEATLAETQDLLSPSCRVLDWRCAEGLISVMTDIKPLALSAGQRLVMLTFAPAAVVPGLLAAIDTLPFDLLILDRTLKVTYANAGAIRTGGVAAGGVLGVSALRLMPTSALHPSIFAHALQGTEFHDDALEISAAGQPARWYEVDVQALKAASGIIGLVVLSTEVTERRLREQPSSSGDRRLLALTEHARDIISVASPDGRLLYVSGGVRNSLGYTSEERQTNSLFAHVHPDDHEALWAQYQQLVAGEINAFSREFRVRHKDGSYRWMESSYTAALDNPLIGGVVINSRDITERKLAEGRLAQREEVFRLAADAVNGVIYEWDVARGLVHRSRGVLEVLGLEPEDLPSTIDAWWARVHPQDFEEVKKVAGLALLNGRGWTTTYRIRDVRGRYRSILERGLIQRNAGGDPVRVIGCCVDVSEIKRVTDLLAETQRAAKMGGWEFSFATRELTWTDEMYSIYEADPDVFIVSWESMLERCMPESLQRFNDACKQSEAAGGQIDLELEIATLKNRRIWVRIIGHLEHLEGRPFRAFGSLQNVQAQKLAQIALENSTGWLKLSMNMAHMHAWRWDRARDVFEFALVDGRQGPLPDAFSGMKKLITRVHPADRQSVTRAIDHAFEHRSEVLREFRLKSAAGRYRWFEAIARPLFDESDLPRGLVGVVQDITERREADMRLRRSEELLRATTANTADTLVLVDTALKIRFINKNIGGMSIEEIIGCGIGVLLPEAARDGVVKKLRHILQTGQTATYEFESSEGDHVQYFENRAVLVRDDGTASGISISTRDITERKRLEQEILDVSGRERQNIGRDLHDGLGQELTGVALMLRGLGAQVKERCPEALDSVNEIVALVNQSIENARSLARGLLPVRTETGGLVSALRELASRSRDVYGMDVDFRAQVWPPLRLDETDASHLYRIAQEALTNAARHGHATQVDIFLKGNRKTFLLRITDNGEGFRPQTSPYSGMGLKIMQYRAGMIGAKFEIAAREPQGTVIRVTGEQPLRAPIQSARID
ncbi:MAG TPA: PAS domain S-box protein [Steroidobacteraceae bacterium]|jgi:PAS domain S-box-containing protein|nr:PAS domain S-box protein [Steroidobacteraceae bacterium]